MFFMITRQEHIMRHMCAKLLHGDVLTNIAISAAIAHKNSPCSEAGDKHLTCIDNHLILLL